jgi:hypothetical protein
MKDSLLVLSEYSNEKATDTGDFGGQGTKHTFIPYFSCDHFPLCYLCPDRVLACVIYFLE